MGEPASEYGYGEGSIEPSAWTHRHAVQFYEPGHFLSDSLFDFCIRSLDAGDPLVLICTRPHLNVIRTRLAERGFDWEALCHTAAAAWHDAEKILGLIMVQGEPEPQRFRAILDRVLAPWSGMSDRWTVRVFGEIVDVLCQRGEHDAALRLEELWNELAPSHRFTLLCGYSMANLHREVNEAAYRGICAAHDHVLPSAPRGSRRTG